MFRKVTTIGIVLMVLVIVAPVSAQKKAANGNSVTEQTLKDIENKWVAALAKGDAATVDSILADEYVETDELGNVTDKQADISALKSGDLKFDSVKNDELHVHLYGNAAVVTGVGSQSGTFKGKPLPNKVRFTDTFVKQKGAWKAVASHLSAVNEGS